MHIELYTPRPQQQELHDQLDNIGSRFLTANEDLVRQFVF